MKKSIRSLILFISIFLFLISGIMNVSVKGENYVNDIDDNMEISYKVSLKDKGWQDLRSNGELSNTPMQNVGIDAININCTNNLGLKLKYQVYSETLGWQNEVNNNDETAGVIGKNIKAIKINILNDKFNKQEDYSIYYRVYTSDTGWLKWGKNGEEVGEINTDSFIQSIQICIAKRNTEKYNKMEFLINNNTNNSIVYETHVAKIGNQEPVRDGDVAGTTNKDYGIESIRIKYNNNLGVLVKYEGYVAGSGWQNEVSDGDLCGTNGKTKSLQAVKIWLEDENGVKSKSYSICYRVYTNGAWSEWTNDGNIAGKENSSKINAIEIRVENVIINKNYNSSNNFNNDSIRYSAHVQKIGDQAEVKDGQIAGTVGKSLSIEAIKICYDNSIGLKVRYRAHVAKVGWQDYKNSGEIAGTKGKKLPIEAIQIYLEDKSGKKSEEYSVYYRAHVAKIGWQTWVKDNKVAGTTGQSKQVQAIEICVVKKGTSKYCEMEDLCNNNFEKVTYKVHASKVGWENTINNESIAGKGDSNANNIEAINLGYSSSIGISIKAQAHVSKVGWTNAVTGKNITIGTTGKSLPIESVKLSLVDRNGKQSENYSIYYRVYSGLGWLGWTKNGQQAGTTGRNLSIKAIQICIRKIGTNECIDMEKKVNVKSAMTAIEEKVYVTKNQLISLGWKNVSDSMVKECNNALKKFGITNTARIRHFISQCSYESGLGKYTKELTSGNQYDGRRDLGNIYQGDGARFKGAGYIQVTGRSNYQSFCNYIGDKRVMEGCSYVASKYPWSISAYWWYRNNMNAVADRGASVTEVTRKVNGGTRGLSSRINYYNKCCNIFK